MITLENNLEAYFDRLWAIPRSITGPGFRDSLKILSELVPFDSLEFLTGQKVLDWEIPKEWVPHNAYFVDPKGKKWAEFKNNNLHLVGYSSPFNGVLSLSDLKKHIHTLPSQPSAIPYLTSYYKEYWGFCLAHKDAENLPDGEYKVVVDTQLIKGKLVLGESLLKGRSKKEVLFSSYLCHPSMANNELSGPLVLAFLYNKIVNIPNRFFTYRFVLSPETIGAVAFLSQRGDHLKKNLIAGYQLTCIGDGAPFTYKKSRRNNSLADRTAIAVVGKTLNHKIIPFNPAIGSDDRQYCSPGFDLPFGSLMRTMYTLYPEYHTSLDNKSLMNFKKMEEAVDCCFELVQAIENNWFYKNLSPRGEPCLGPRGLFRTLSGKETNDEESSMWWLLNYSDGRHDLLTISELSGCKMNILVKIAEVLEKAGLLKKLKRSLI